MWIYVLGGIAALCLAFYVGLSVGIWLCMEHVTKKRIDGLINAAMVAGADPYLFECAVLGQPPPEVRIDRAAAERLEKAGGAVMADRMRVYVAPSHAGHYLQGSSVVVAPNETEARRMLDEELRTHGLTPNDYELVEIETDSENVIVLFNGDY